MSMISTLLELARDPCLPFRSCPFCFLSRSFPLQIHSPSPHESTNNRLNIPDDLNGTTHYA